MDEMKGKQTSRYDRFWLKCVIVLVLAFTAAWLVQQLAFCAIPAAAIDGSAGELSSNSGRNGGIVAVAGRISRDTYGLYLVDLKNGTICVYGMAGNGQLKLLAARTFIYDCQLDSYNTTPLPKEIARLVARARRLKTVPAKP